MGAPACMRVVCICSESFGIVPKYESLNHSFRLQVVTRISTSELFTGDFLDFNLRNISFCYFCVTLFCYFLPCFGLLFAVLFCIVFVPVYWFLLCILESKHERQCLLLRQIYVSITEWTSLQKQIIWLLK